MAYRFGVIGLGVRISSVIDQALVQMEGEAVLAAIADPKSKDQLLKNIWPSTMKEPVEGAALYSTAEEMLENEKLDGVFVGTRCSSHARFAQMVHEKGLPLFLEKPICINMEDFKKLRDGYKAHNDTTVVSFPLRFTPVVCRVKNIVDSGVLGKIEHVSAVNYVPYGGTYFHDWYRDESETGGLFLQKSTHDFDYINFILGTDPVMVAAMASKQIFKGDHEAGLKCVDCDQYRECTESPYFINEKHDPENESRCCYAVDTGNHDSASTLVRYESGMHVGYTQNFFARQKSLRRGAVFSGYKGTLEFDFYTSEIRVFYHQVKDTELIKISGVDKSHFGGDAVLIKNFLNVVRGTEKSKSTLRDGLMSALMCLKARESAETSEFKQIIF